MAGFTIVRGFAAGAGAGAGAGDGAEGVVGVVDERIGWGSSSGVCGTCGFGSFGRRISSSRILSSTSAYA